MYTHIGTHSSMKANPVQISEIDIGDVEIGEVEKAAKLWIII